MKKAGVIVASAILILIIILLAVNKGISKKAEGGGESSPSPSVSVVESKSASKTYDVGMFRVVDASLLDYTVPVLETSGTVSDKQIYLDGNQIVYLVLITLDELNSSTVKYYCSYDVYKSVGVNTRLSVSYQKLTESAFSVCSVSAK